MTGLKAVSAIIVLALGFEGSTCHGQASGGSTGEAAKDTSAGPFYIIWRRAPSVTSARTGWTCFST